MRTTDTAFSLPALVSLVKIDMDVGWNSGEKQTYPLLIPCLNFSFAFLNLRLETRHFGNFKYISGSMLCDFCSRRYACLLKRRLLVVLVIS